MSDIDKVLAERGKNYGRFEHHALLAQSLKRVFRQHTKDFNFRTGYTPSQLEAIDMIFHKIGRIGNGDPNYIDSWVDIIGYAQLVVNELEAAAKEKQSQKEK